MVSYGTHPNKGKRYDANRDVNTVEYDGHTWTIEAANDGRVRLTPTRSDHLQIVVAGNESDLIGGER